MMRDRDRNGLTSVCGSRECACEQQHFHALQLLRGNFREILNVICTQSPERPQQRSRSSLNVLRSQCHLHSFLPGNGDFCAITMWGNTLVLSLSKMCNSRATCCPDSELSLNGSLWTHHLLCESTSLFIFSLCQPGETCIYTFSIYLNLLSL